MDKPSQVLKEIWQNLQDGAESRHNGYHLMTFHYDNNGFPRANTVVVRKCSPNDRRVRFHSDLRQNKVQAIERNNRVCLLFYNKKDKIQIICSGHAKVITDSTLTEKVWNHMQPISRICYCQDLTPGEQHPELNHGFTPKQWDSRNEKATIEYGFKNFSIIETTIHEIEWLYLCANGNERLCFTYDKKNEKWRSNWLIP